MRIRDADPSDIAALQRVKESAALHRDRVRDAAGGSFRYLVLEDDDGEVVGHACLVFSRPAGWPPDEEATPYPRVIDLRIAAGRRRQGLGSELVRRMESICIQRGLDRLHLSVDPERNAGALKFYETLGYTAEPGGPRWRAWRFRDSEGNVHRGEGLDLRMSKELA